MAKSTRVIPVLPLGKELGSGSLATVYQVEYPVGKKKKIAAAKKYRIERATGKPAVNVDDVAHFMETHGSQYLVEGFRHNSKAFHIYMEYMPKGSLEGLAPVSYPFQFHLIIRTGLGIAAMHSIGYAHRDIKPANILLDAKRDAKLNDFDFIQQIVPFGSVEPAGTALFAAPENFFSSAIQRSYLPHADIYMFGLLIVSICLGAKRFDTAFPANLTSIVANRNADSKGLTKLESKVQELTTDDESQFGYGLGELVLSTLQVSPNRRPNIFNLLNDLFQCALRYYKTLFRDIITQNLKHKAGFINLSVKDIGGYYCISTYDTRNKCLVALTRLFQQENHKTFAMDVAAELTQYATNEENQVLKPLLPPKKSLWCSLFTCCTSSAAVMPISEISDQVRFFKAFNKEYIDWITKVTSKPADIISAYMHGPSYD